MTKDDKSATLMLRDNRRLIEDLITYARPAMEHALEQAQYRNRVTNMELNVLLRSAVEAAGAADLIAAVVAETLIELCAKQAADLCPVLVEQVKEFYSRGIVFKVGCESYHAAVAARFPDLFLIVPDEDGLTVNIQGKPAKDKSAVEIMHERANASAAVELSPLGENVRRMRQAVEKVAGGNFGEMLGFDDAVGNNPSAFYSQDGFLLEQAFNNTRPRVVNCKVVLSRLRNRLESLKADAPGNDEIICNLRHLIDRITETFNPFNWPVIEGFYGGDLVRGGHAIEINGERIAPARSQAIWNHSPDGFNWGYAGSGPAQAALAILLELTGEETATRYHQAFKFDFLAGLAQEKDFRLVIDVDGWLRQTREKFKPVVRERNDVRTCANKDCGKEFIPEPGDPATLCVLCQRGVPLV